MFRKKQTRKQSSISFDVSVRGYNHWVDAYHLKPLVAGMLIFTIIGGLTWQNVWAFFGFGVEAQTEDIVSQEVLEASSVPLVSMILDRDLLEAIDDDESDYSLQEMIALYERAVESSTRAEVVKVWVDKTISPRDIWEGNQALYMNGHPDVDGPSHLIGTILIGDLPLPIVDKKGSLWQTPYPYTDFKDPVYRWDEKVQRFVFFGDGDFKPDIWHGVINHTHIPIKDEGVSAKEQDEYQRATLRDWFMQNYLSHGKDIPNMAGDSFAQDQTSPSCPTVFTSTSPIGGGLEFTNQGVVDDVLYDKRVLVIDQDISKRGIDDDLELRYDLLMENIDDVVYLRQNKHWNKAVLDAIEAAESLQEDTSLEGEALNLLADNQTKAILDALLQHYESYFSGYLSKVTTDIERSGKYSSEDIDTPMGLITQVDLGSAMMVKNLNAGFEGYLLRMFEDRSIASDITIRTHAPDPNDRLTLIPAYWNGVFRDNLDVEDCSLLRGYPRQQTTNSFADSAITTQMAEMNRVFNDTTFGQCGGGYNGCCADNMRISGNGTVTKVNCNTDQWATKPIFDLAGGAEVFSGSIGASGCAPIIETDLSKYNLPEEDYLLHTFHSFMIHDEPRIETIMAQVENQDTFAMPIDNPRGVSFYNNSLNFYRFNFVDWFELRPVIASSNGNKQVFIHAMRNLFTNKLNEFNSLGGGSSLDTNPLGVVGRDTLKLFESNPLYDDGVGLGINGRLIFERLSWLEKDLEEKHHNILATIFTRGDKAGVGIDTNNTLIKTDFEGYEMILYSTSNAPEGVVTTVELEEKEPTESYLNRVIEDASFQEKYVSPPVVLFDARFDEDLSGYGSVPCGSDLPLQERLACEVQNNYREAQNVFYADGSFSSANEIVDLVDSIELVQEGSSVVSQGDSSPHSLLVYLKDKDGNIITQDSHTKVTLSGGNGYSIGPFETVTAQRGVAQFMVLPQKNRSMERVLFEARVNRGGKVLVSNKISIETVPYQLRISHHDTPTVLSNEGIEVHARLVGSGYEVMKNRTDLVEFRSESGSFIGENPTSLVDGRASILFVPSTKAEEVEVTIHPVQSNDIAPGKALVDVAPGDPQLLQIIDRPSYFIENGGFVPVSVAVTDVYGNVVDVPQNYTWVIENGMIEGGSETTVQQMSVEGVSQIFIRPIQNGESVFVQVSSSGVPTDQSKRIEIRFLEGVSVEGDSNTQITHKASDTSLFEIPLRLSETIEGSVEVSVSSNSKLIGVFPEYITFVNGEAVLKYYSSGKSGQTEVQVGGNGIEPFSVPVEFEPNKGVKIRVEGGNVIQKSSTEGLKNSETERDANIEGGTFDEDDETRRQGQLELTVLVIDEYGNIDTNYNGPVRVHVNENDDQEDFELAADILIDSEVYRGSKDEVVDILEEINTKTLTQNISVRLPYRSVVNIESGVGTLWLQAETVGNDYLSFFADGLISDAHEVQVETTTDWLLEDVRTKAQSIFALGWKAESQIAHHFLMNESSVCSDEPENQVQSFVSTKTSLAPMAQYGYVSPNGHFSDRFQALLEEGSEYGFHFASKSDSEIIIAGKYLPSRTVDFVDGVSRGEDTIGITKKHAESAFVIKDKQLMFKGAPMLQWNEQGAVVWKDASVVIEFPTNNIFEWNVYSGYHHLAFVQYGASKEQSTVYINSDQEIPSSDNNAIILEVLDSTIDSEKTRTMGGFADKEGVLFHSTADIEIPERRLGFIYDSIEDDGGDVQSFFGGNWKPGVLFSSGSSVGESVAVGASDNVIVYGDPTTRSSNKNLESSLGITDDLGDLIYSFGPKEEIQNIIDIDFNGDEVQDLLVFTKENTWIVYQDVGQEEQFLLPRKVMRPDQINADSVAAILFDEDKQEDLVALHSNGGLYWYKNIGSQWEKPEEIYIDNPVYPLISFQKARLEEGPRNDLVVEDSNGSLWGIFIQDGVVKKEVQFDSFAPEVQAMTESFAGSASLLNKNDYPILSEATVQFNEIQERVSGELFSYNVGESVPVSEVLNTNAWRQMSLSADSSQDRALPGTIFDVRLVFETDQTYTDFVLSLPGFDGMENIPGSWSCNGCNDNVVVVLSEGVEVKSDRMVPSVIEITWQAEVSSLKPLRYMVEDFAGDDGIDDIAVAKIINGQEKIIQFTTTGSGVVDRESWSVSTTSVLVAQAPLREGVYEYSEEHVQSVVSPVNRVDLVEPFDPNARSEDADRDGIPDAYDLVPNVANTINPSQALDTIHNGVASGSVADVTSVAASSSAAGSQATSAANGSVGSLSSDANGAGAMDTILEDEVSTMTQESTIVKATYKCGDPRCGTKVESSAPQAPGAATVRKDHEASPGSVGIGSAVYWTPRDKPQPKSSKRLYRGSSNTGKSYVVVCKGVETSFLDPGKWNPNCNLSVVPTGPSAQSCGVAPGNTATNPGSNQASANFLMDQSNNLFANDQGPWNKGTKQVEPDNKSNITLLGADVIGTWAQNQYRALSRWKLPRLNLVYTKAPATDNLLKDIHLHQNVTNSGSHNLQTQTLFIPYPQINKNEFEVFEKKALQWIEKTEDWIGDAQFIVDTKDAPEIEIILEEAKENVVVMNENIDTVRQYLAQKQLLLDLQDSLQDLLMQTQKNQDAIAEMNQAWIEQIQNDMKPWLTFRTNLQSIFQSWEVHSRKLDSFTKACSGCGVTRATLIEWLVRSGPLSVGIDGFQNDGDADIFQLTSRPPDVTLDMSRIIQGNNVPLLDVHLSPVELAITSVPAFYPPLDEGRGIPSGIGSLIALPKVTESIDLQNSVPDVALEFPRFLADLHTPEELKSFFAASGENLIPAPPEDFAQMQKNLSSALKVHTKNFGELCRIMQGQSKVPEWFVRPNIELVSNRQSFLPRDWVKRSRNPVVSQKSTEDRVQYIDFNLAYSDKDSDDYYRQVNNHVQTEYGKMSCLVQNIQHAFVTKSSAGNEVCDPAEKAATLQTAHRIDSALQESIVFDYEDLFDSMVVRSNPDVILDRASIASEKDITTAWIQDLETESFDTSNWVASTEEVPHTTEAGERTAHIYYFDKKTGVSDVATTYNLNRKHVGLMADMNKDENTDVIIGNGADLFIKYQRKDDLEDPINRYPNLEQSEEVFVAAHPPIAQTDWYMSPEQELVLPTEFLEEGYTEWFHVDRTMSEKITDRVGLYLWNTDENEIQKQPIVIHNIQGKVDIKTSAIGLPLHSVRECQNPESQTELVVGTNILGTVGTSRVLWTNVIGDVQEIILKEGEFIERSSGTVCATSGQVYLENQQLQTYTTSLSKQVPITNLSEIITPKGSSVDLRFGNGFLVSIPENQHYTIHIHSKENVPPFVRLKRHDNSVSHGYLVSATKKGLSTTLPTGLHQSFISDDTQAPIIDIENGVDQNVPLYESFTINARQTTDNRNIDSVWWDFDSSFDSDGDGMFQNDNDFPGWGNTVHSVDALLHVTIPGQSEPRSRSITLYVQDEAGNIASQEIFLSFDAPKLNISPVTSDDNTVIGEGSLPSDASAQLWRQRRNGDWTLLGSVDGTSSNGIVFDDISKDNGLMLSGDTADIEILENGRIVVDRGLYTVETSFATQSVPFGIQVKTPQGNTVGGVVLSLRGQDVFIEESVPTNPNEGITLVSNVYEWKPIEGESWGDNSYALVDTQKDITYAIFDENGQLYDVQDGMLVSLDSSSNSGGPLSFSIFDEAGVVIGSVVINTSDLFLQVQK